MNKIFRVTYPSGAVHYVVSRASWAGMISFVESIKEEYRDETTIGPASLFELIKYIIKGV